MMVADSQSLDYLKAKIFAFGSGAMVGDFRPKMGRPKKQE